MSRNNQETRNSEQETPSRLFTAHCSLLTERMRSKRYQATTKALQGSKIVPLAEGVQALKKTSTVKFDASVEVHVRLGIDTSHSDQLVRSSVTLPHGTGKTKRVAVFALGADQETATQSGADLVGGEELIAIIKTTGKCDFDVAVATPTMMPKLAGIAKILGPKGLMPSPKNETITTNIAKIVGELKKGRVAFKTDTTGNVHVMVGKASWEESKITENIQAFLNVLTKLKPSSSKGVFIQSVTLCSTMGPGIRVSL